MTVTSDGWTYFLPRTYHETMTMWKTLTYQRT